MLVLQLARSFVLKPVKELQIQVIEKPRFKKEGEYIIGRNIIEYSILILVGRGGRVGMISE